MNEKKPFQQRVDEIDFSDQGHSSSYSLVREFIDFMRCNKKWWLAPVIAILLMFGALLVLSASVAAPFIYTLF